MVKDFLKSFLRTFAEPNIGLQHNGISVVRTNLNPIVFDSPYILQTQA